MTREHTKAPNPARYLPGFTAEAIKALEMGTAHRADRRRELTSSKSEYLRDMSTVVGWDQGQDATLSFVECAGGEIARSFHGRPMCTGNSKARGDWTT